MGDFVIAALLVLTCIGIARDVRPEIEKWVLSERRKKYEEEVRRRKAAEMRKREMKKKQQILTQIDTLFWDVPEGGKS